MTTDVDLQQLAIDRGDAPRSILQPRRHLLSRYVLPGLLLAGFLSLLAWASWDFAFPPRAVTVVPVLATQAPVQREGTPLFKAAGWVEPRPTPVRAAALAAGVVEELLVVQDQPVAAGQPLAELVKDDARLACEQADADLRLREAELDLARASLAAATTRFEQPVHLQAMLSEAEGALARLQTQRKLLPFDIQQAEARLLFAQQDYEGKRSAAGAVAGRAIDEAKSRMDAAQALLEGRRDKEASLKTEQAALAGRRDALQKQLELLADEIQAKDEAAAQVKAATARLEQARVALTQARLRLDRMTVRAPIGGRVYQLVGHPGTVLSGSMPKSDAVDSSTVVTLYRPEMLQVRVDVRFEDIPKVSLSQPVEIDNPALASPLAGSVLFVSSEADIQKNTLQVKVAIDTPPAVFKPEMLVDVTFLAPAEPEQPADPSDEMRLYVPPQLVQQDDRGTFVWVADQTARRARRQPVETAGMHGELIEVRSGLTPASRLVSSGSERLRDGARIRIAGEQAQGSSGRLRPERQPRMNRLPTGGN